MTDIMPKGMDDDLFNEEEQRHHKAMMDAEEQLERIRHQQEVEWERQYESQCLE